MADRNKNKIVEVEHLIVSNIVLQNTFLQLSLVNKWSTIAATFNSIIDNTIIKINPFAHVQILTH